MSIYNIYSGSYSDTLRISHNDPPGDLGQDDITVNYEIIEGQFNIDTSLSDISAYFSVGPNTIVTSSAEVSNTGTGSLNIVSITSSDSAVLSLSPTSFEIESGGSAQNLVIMWNCLQHFPSLSLSLSLSLSVCIYHITIFLIDYVCMYVCMLLNRRYHG